MSSYSAPQTTAAPIQQQQHQPYTVPYTAIQQDRQARNRPTHAVHSPVRLGASMTASDAALASALREDETYEELQRKERAARILDSQEMLIWFSTVRNESLPQTRYHFTKILAGLESDPESESEHPNTIESNRSGDRVSKSNPKRSSGSGSKGRIDSRRRSSGNPR